MRPWDGDGSSREWEFKGAVAGKNGPCFYSWESDRYRILTILKTIPA